MGKGMRAGKKPSKPAGMGGGSMQKQLQQMQAMQRQMEALQAEIEEKEVQTTAGGGAVSVTISGKRNHQAGDQAGGLRPGRHRNAAGSDHRRSQRRAAPDR